MLTVTAVTAVLAYAWVSVEIFENCRAKRPDFYHQAPRQLQFVAICWPIIVLADGVLTVARFVWRVRYGK